VLTSILHLTNGSAIIPMMRAAGVEGRVVPWDDVLHEGPVPAGLNIAALRDVRTDFLASCGWDSRQNIARRLAERDAALEAPFDEIVLWFEHDLYDQLQVLQILDRLPMDGPPRITAVPDGDYLGQLTQAQFQGLFAARRDVTSAERSATRDAWNAFRAADPRGVAEVLPRVTVLPHLGPALLRHLQQFPSMDTGLSRTEQQTLEVMVTTGVTRVRDVYVKSHHQREDAIFMGDAAFLSHIGALMVPPRPLIRALSRARRLSLDDDIEPTDDGLLVVARQADRIALSGIDRWLGGVHLLGHGQMWRWDDRRRLLRFV